MSETNPYQAPVADLTTETPEAPDTFRLINPRSVPIGHGWSWIAGGFDHFKKEPGEWIQLTIVGLIIMIVLLLVPFGWFAVLGTTYVWIAGIMLGCRAQDRGEDFKLKYLFAGFSSKPVQLILLALIGISVIAIILGPTYMEMIAMNFRGGHPDPEAMRQLSEKLARHGGFFRTWLVTMVCSLPLDMAVWFTPALMVLNDVPLLRALKLSFIGCLKNILPFLLYIIIGMIIYLLSAIPLLLGLLVSLPTLMASWYTAYTDIFIEKAEV